jgi:ubiquinone biosynthesis monooxygenase Coq7
MSLLDPVILQIDQALRTLFVPAPTKRPMPGESLPEPELTEPERRHAAALMRINHVGEVCAQALYAGQAFAAASSAVREALKRAAWEETEHLNWTERRIEELGGRKSLLNPLWYTGSLAIGAVAGALGDKWNLGFLAETERQVGAHLQSHLVGLPPQDAKSRAVAQQMYVDEVGHSDMAVALGAAELPLPVKLAMRGMSKVMTKTVYWV